MQCFINGTGFGLNGFPFLQGFSGITDIAGGYAAWTQTGLPTEK